MDGFGVKLFTNTGESVMIFIFSKPKSDKAVKSCSKGSPIEVSNSHITPSLLKKMVNPDYLFSE